MSRPKLAFEVWPEFPFISERLEIRDFPDLECAPDGGHLADWELTGIAGLSEDGSHGQASFP